ILVAVAWVLIGGALKIDIGQLTPLYLGEIISVWAFGASWLAKGEDLRRILRRRPRPAEPGKAVPRHVAAVEGPRPGRARSRIGRARRGRAGPARSGGQVDGQEQRPVVGGWRVAVGVRVVADRVRTRACEVDVAVGDAHGHGVAGQDVV